MRFSVDQESIDEVITQLISYCNELDVSFLKFKDDIMTIAIKTNYNKLLRALQEIVEIYNKDICVRLREKLINYWREEGEALHTFAKAVYMGDNSEEAVERIEEALNEIFIRKSDNELLNLKFDGDSNATEKDFEVVVDCLEVFRKATENSAETVKKNFEEKSEENEVYRFLIPIVESIGVAIVEFLVSAKTEMSRLGDNYAGKMHALKDRVEEVKINGDLEFDLSLFDIDDSSISMWNNTSGSNIFSNERATDGAAQDTNTLEKEGWSVADESPETLKMKSEPDKTERVKSVKEFLSTLKAKIQQFKSGSGEKISKIAQWLTENKPIVMKVLKILSSVMSMLPAENAVFKVITSMIPKVTEALEGKVETKEDVDKLELAIKLMEKLGIMESDSSDESSSVAEHIQNNPAGVTQNIINYIYENADSMKALGLIRYDMYNEIKHHNLAAEDKSQIMYIPYKGISDVKYDPMIDNVAADVSKDKMLLLNDKISSSKSNNIFANADNMSAATNELKTILNNNTDNQVAMSADSYISKIVQEINNITNNNECPSLLESKNGKYNRDELKLLAEELDSSDDSAKVINNYVRKRYGYPKIDSKANYPEISEIAESDLLYEYSANNYDVCNKLGSILANADGKVTLSESPEVKKYIEEVVRIADDRNISTAIKNDDAEGYNVEELKQLHVFLERASKHGDNLGGGTYNYLASALTANNKYSNELAEYLKSTDAIKEIEQELTKLNENEYIPVKPETRIGKVISDVNKIAEKNKAVPPVRILDGRCTMDGLKKMRAQLKNAAEQSEANKASYSDSIPVVESIRELIPIIDNSEENFIVNNNSLKTAISEASQIYGNENYEEKKSAILNFLLKIGVAGLTAITCGWPVSLLVLLFGFNGDNYSSSFAKLVSCIGEKRTELLLSRYNCNGNMFSLKYY